MDTFNSLMAGFSVALQPAHLLVCSIGVFLGTLVGALPGIGPVGAIAMLLSATYKLGPTASIIMLAGIYYGTQYGGTITAVMMGIPGEASSVPTTFDGYTLAKEGRAGAALSIAAIGSFVGGTVSVIGLMIFGPMLADTALKFGPLEFFALMMLAFSLVTAFTGNSVIKGFISLTLGLIVGMVGQDVISGTERFTFGCIELLDGICFLPIAVGMFGLGEIIENFESKSKFSVIKADLRLSKIYPQKKDLKESFWPMIRGTIVGFWAGILPGVGASLSSFLSYAIEKLISKTPEKFGHGAIAGVAGPETANNAVTGASFIPMLSLGIPGGAVAAILMGALIMFGITPGPTIFKENPDIVFGLIASMYVGNILLVIINSAFIPIIVYIMDKIKPYIAITVLLLASYGVYSTRGTITDVLIMLIAGFVGYLMRKMDFPLAPLILSVLLGPMAEHKLRMAISLSGGEMSYFFASNISNILFALTILSIWIGVKTLKGKGRIIRAEDES